MAGLLVSVRSASEARVALAGGAGLIDVKEPSGGALGRAEAATIAAVLDEVAGRRPVSAALGELRDWAGEGVGLAGRLAYVKWGLAGCPGDWRERLAAGRQRVEEGSSCRVVVTAYADWRRAGAPAPAEVARYAVQSGGAVLLIDTWGKDGTTLLSWLPRGAVEELVGVCHGGGVQVALGGSLGVREIETLSAVGPEWFAVRGAACRESVRGGVLEEERVRRLAEAVRASPFSSGSENR